MAKPNRTEEVHICIFDLNAQRIKRAMVLILNKDSLDNNDIQAIREMLGTLEFLLNPSQENGALYQAIYSNVHHEEFQ